MEWPLVPILVVVAITQARALRAEEEKGSERTAFVFGSVDPKPHPNGVIKVGAWRGGESASGRRVARVN